MRPHVQEDFEVAVHEGDPDEQTAPPEVPQLQGVRGPGGQAVTQHSPAALGAGSPLPCSPAASLAQSDQNHLGGLRIFEVLMNPGGS